MHTFIYTKSLDNADELLAKSLDFEKQEDAMACFKSRVQNLVAEALSNPCLNFKMSMHNNKALIQVESVHHCVAVVEDGGILEQ